MNEELDALGVSVRNAEKTKSKSSAAGPSPHNYKSV